MHVIGCDGDDHTGRCAACHWFRKRVAEAHAWHRWYAMVAFYPRDSYRPAGMGCG